MANRRGGRSPGWSRVRLGYIARARIPSDKANSLQVMKMAAAFASLAGSVELVVPFQGGSKGRDRDLWDRYAIAPTFRLTWLPYPHLGRKFDIRGYATTSWLYTQLQGFDVVYTRDLWVAHLLSRWGRPVKVGFEAHDLSEESRYPVWAAVVNPSHLPSRVRGIFCISHGLAEAYRQAGARPELLQIAPDGVDLRLFSPARPKTESRNQLGLPLQPPIVCHAGQLYPGRGIEETIEAVSGIPGTLLVLVGGQREDISRLKGWVHARGWGDWVRFEGQVPNSRVPWYLWAADVLVMPYTSRTPTVQFMSPLKMFEYMASGRPIVGTDFPAIREVLESGRSAILVPPDDIVSLRNGIQSALTGGEAVARMAEVARAEAGKYTWLERATRILELLA